MCPEYDLCDACHSSNAHPSEHQILKIESLEDAEDLEETVSALPETNESC